MKLDSTCSRCYAAIRWATIQDSGKRVPLEVGPEADGRYYTVTSAPLVVRTVRHADAVPAGVKRWAPHFASCAARPKRRRPVPAQVELALVDEEV